jgi:hypothetical protein
MWVIYPETNRKMWFARVKQLFQPILHILPHIPEPDMVSPVLGSIFSERPFLQTVAGDIPVEV